MKRLWLILMAAPSLVSAQEAPNAGSRFFATLRGLCGARYEGAKTFPPDSTDSFAGKRLVAAIASCTETEIRVPFLVGEDRSRTWVFTLTAQGLRLQHDHRHADGTPDSVTMYGGMARATGTPLAQSFPADEYTARLIPAAVTNVWTVSLSADRDTLTYHLERDTRPRFTAVLTRVRQTPVGLDSAASVTTGDAARLDLEPIPAPRARGVGDPGSRRPHPATARAGRRTRRSVTAWGGRDSSG